MAYDPVVVPAYPDVPYAAGVPPVARNSAFAIGAAGEVLVLADATSLTGAFAPKPWGIFTAQGQPALDGDSVTGVELKRDMQIPSYPVEQGGFASFNKVQIPYDARITYTVGGSDARRGAFLQAVEQMLQSLTLYTVTMPDFFYAAANVVHYDFARRGGEPQGAHGIGLLTVNIWLEEVRSVATSALTGSGIDNQGQGPVQQQSSQAQQILFPKQPSGASPNQVGPVQAQPTSDYSSVFGPGSTPHFFGSPNLANGVNLGG